MSRFQSQNRTANQRARDRELQKQRTVRCRGGTRKKLSQIAPRNQSDRVGSADCHQEYFQRNVQSVLAEIAQHLIPSETRKFIDQQERHYSSSARREFREKL